MIIVLGVDDESLRKTTLQLLCCLLPTPNRDTLKALLEFLSKVDFYSEDRVDENAIEVISLRRLSLIYIK
jgi:hypothetical protein